MIWITDNGGRIAVLEERNTEEPEHNLHPAIEDLVPDQMFPRRSLCPGWSTLGQTGPIISLLQNGKDQRYLFKEKNMPIW